MLLLSSRLQLFDWMDPCARVVEEPEVIVSSAGKRIMWSLAFNYYNSMLKLLQSQEVHLRVIFETIMCA